MMRLGTISLAVVLCVALLGHDEGRAQGTADLRTALVRTDAATAGHAWPQSSLGSFVVNSDARPVPVKIVAPRFTYRTFSHRGTAGPDELIRAMNAVAEQGWEFPAVSIVARDAKYYLVPAGSALTADVPPQVVLRKRK